MKPRLSQPIASLLLRRVFKWVILCIVLFSSLQAYLNYRAIERNFDMTIRDVANTHLPMLSLAIWDIELQAIQKQISLLTKNTNIAYVVIKASTGQQFVGGNGGNARADEHLTFDIPAPDGKGSRIGTMELMVDRSVLRQELMRSFLIVLTEVILLSVFIFAAVYTILRRDLERPMRQLADFVNNLQANKIATRLELDLGPRHVYNEIDLVVDGFRTMQDRLQKYIEHQDALVSERTVQLQQAMDRLKKLSITDVLTGCYNRLFFHERMPGEMHRAIRYERDLSVVFCDIDYFKSVNDQHGHGVGDDVLIAFVDSLQRELRAEIDWLVRYGGEEFLIVLPETPLPAAIEAAERMRVNVERDLKVTLPDGQRLNVTASFGVAERVADDTIETLVQRADQCLYLSKSLGRNQIQPASGSTSQEVDTL